MVLKVRLGIPTLLENSLGPKCYPSVGAGGWTNIDQVDMRAFIHAVRLEIIGGLYLRVNFRAFLDQQIQETKVLGTLSVSVVSSTIKLMAASALIPPDLSSPDCTIAPDTTTRIPAGS
jgi:hypothetical protein